MHIPTVGEQVRVISKDKIFSSRAIISDCGPNGTFDVIFNDTQQGDEEIAVPSDRITPLEPFEKDAAENFIDAELLKSHGNVLFTLKDFSAALEYYKKAIRAADIASSSPEVFSTGQCVLVSFQNSIDYQTGIISDVDTGTGAADIMFDDDTLEEEVAIPFSRLQPLPAARKDRLLHRSVYMNMARSVLKKEQKGWAIKYSSIALAIARHFQAQLREADSSEAGTVSSPTEVSKMLADGYYFRGKTLLMACRPKFATQDCRSLQEFDSTKAAALQKEIHSFKEKAAKSNRKLARDIASWVETAMSADAAKKGIRGAHASSTEDASDADLNVLEDGDGDADGDGRGDGRGDGGGGAAGYRHVGSTVRGKSTSAHVPVANGTAAPTQQQFSFLAMSALVALLSIFAMILFFLW